MKNLANCKPTEFLKQTNLIRKSVEKWLDVTKIAEIRKRLPQYEIVPEGASAEEKVELIKRNKDKEQEQAKKNISAILDAMLEEHPEETLEILGLCCFIEPDDIDNHPISEYIGNFYELMSNKDVLNFFTLLMQLVNNGT